MNIRPKARLLLATAFAAALGAASLALVGMRRPAPDPLQARLGEFGLATLVTRIDPSFAGWYRSNDFEALVAHATGRYALGESPLETNPITDRPFEPYVPEAHREMAGDSYAAMLNHPRMTLMVNEVKGPNVPIGKRRFAVAVTVRAAVPDLRYDSTAETGPTDEIYARSTVVDVDRFQKWLTYDREAKKYITYTTDTMPPKLLAKNTHSILSDSEIGRAMRIALPRVLEAYAIRYGEARRERIQRTWRPTGKESAMELETMGRYFDRPALGADAPREGWHDASPALRAPDDAGVDVRR